MDIQTKLLLHGASGEIQLIEYFDKKCSFALSDLLSNLDLKQESIQLFGKSVLQPRLSCFYSDPGIAYRYSQRTFHGLPWTKELEELREQIHSITSYHFNSALVNLYRDGKDSMGLHADDEIALGKNPVIASMNYGSSRKMIFRKNGTKEKIELILKNGDLLIMSGALQHYWKHEVPKQLHVSGERLNITFRQIT